MNRVAFVIAGTQKGGTSALDHYLRAHPRLCMASRKEAHFFDRDRLFRWRWRAYSRYHSFFPALEVPRVLCGEATPIYMYWRSAPRRIRAYNPEMKVIVVLRNPLERAFSHWNMERDRGAEDLPFREALRKEGERRRAVAPRQDRVHSYVDRGFYCQQLERIWECFPQEQTLVLRTESLRADPGPCLDRICDFLGVERMPAVPPATVHARPYAVSLTPEEWHHLARVFAPEIERLEALLGWDCREWRQPPAHL